MNMQSLALLLKWYVTITSIGLAFLPLSSFLFRKFRDQGYPFAKILGLAVFSYFFFVLNFGHVFSLTQEALWGLLITVAFGNWYFWAKNKFTLPKLKTIFTYELFFFIMFFFWSYVKGYEASLRSLEKYMDFGFIQSILNNSYLPPQDMWFASTFKEILTINYYYYGHFVTAFLIRLSSINPSVGYNLMLTSIFALGTTLSYCLGYNLYLQLSPGDKHNRWKPFLAGLLAMAIMNIGGNLHTIYLFTRGYVPENPVPFWQILSWYNPLQYWYPNATRFIPFTIHEFPSYSYVVSDLHGHVLDIPFVLLLIALSLNIVLSKNRRELLFFLPFYSLGLAINYMTNSTDFIVYSVILFFVLVILLDNLGRVLSYFFGTVILAILLTLPFSLSFKPFASAIGVNCAPDFLIKIGRLGPLLFEADKCQTSPFWMLFVLWGFFWFNFLFFLKSIFFTKDGFLNKNKIRYYFFFVYVIAILLTLFAEFFYFKDIYPAHFRANTMFKLGYQSFIMLSILSGVTIVYLLKNKVLNFVWRLLYLVFLLPMLVLILSYYQYAVPSYFGRNGFKTLDGSAWIKDNYPDSYHIIRYLNNQKSQTNPFNLVEAHGDSYTDYNLVSAHTGIPTIIGWPVHEWLWRGTYDVVAPRVEEVKLIYEGQKTDLSKIKAILRKYRVRYVVVAEMEKLKYPQLNFRKFYKIGKVVYSNKETNSYLFEIHD